LNTRSTPRFIARSVNIWANISQAGEPAEASIKCSTASCQWLVVLGLGQLLNVAGGIFQSDQLAAVGKLYGLVESSMPPAVFVDLDFKAGARTFPWRVGGSCTPSAVLAFHWITPRGGVLTRAVALAVVSARSRH
jgi:hypothetical protein